LDLREIARLRLRNQRLTGAKFKTAEEVVGWLGAVQAQEYALAKWSLGERTTDLADSAVNNLLREGRILRTHILRPTWHFVLPADIRWMMALTAPRIAAQIGRSAFTMPDEHHLRRAFDVIGEALSGGRRFTRPQISRMLIEQGLAATAADTIPVFIRAELDLVICSGGLEGKVQTYALVDERSPKLDRFDRDWALGELTRRYFTSHGPATIPDFTWWSSVTVADTKRGLEINGPALDRLDIDGTTYWWAGDTTDSAVPDDASPTVHLLQGYDEYIVAYRSPRPAINVSGKAGATGLSRPPFLHAIVLDTQVVGWWRRLMQKDRALIDTRLLIDLDRRQRDALQAAVDRYSRFLEFPVDLAGPGADN
jgi:Winged helix DNA-binding domain